MCGIVGYIGKLDARKIVLDGLTALEYRGYDSAGIALKNAENGAMFYDTNRNKVVVKVNNVAYNFKYDDAKSIKDFIENVSDMIKPAAQKKKIRFSVEFEKFNPDRSILEDELRLKQVFMNILSNAVKFTPENGSVVLSFETVSANDKTERVKIQFRDTGIGMSRKFIQNSLFTPYSQELNDDTERSSGSGLGLSISKNIIELMNGSIDVQSTPGEGTVFTVCLDFTFADEVQEKKTALESDAEYSGAVNERIKGARVLVCEDVELNS